MFTALKKSWPLLLQAFLDKVIEALSPQRVALAVNVQLVVNTVLNGLNNTGGVCFHYMFVLIIFTFSFIKSKCFFAVFKRCSFVF